MTHILMADDNKEGRYLATPMPFFCCYPFMVLTMLSDSRRYNTLFFFDPLCRCVLNDSTLLIKSGSHLQLPPAAPKTTKKGRPPSGANHISAPKSCRPYRLS
jgi:hypothetical protein